MEVPLNSKQDRTRSGKYFVKRALFNILSPRPSIRQGKSHIVAWVNMMSNHPSRSCSVNPSESEPSRDYCFGRSQESKASRSLNDAYFQQQYFETKSGRTVPRRYVFSRHPRISSLLTIRQWGARFKVQRDRHLIPCVSWQRDIYIVSCPEKRDDWG